MQIDAREFDRTHNVCQILYCPTQSTFRTGEEFYKSILNCYTRAHAGSIWTVQELVHVEHAQSCATFTLLAKSLCLAAQLADGREQF